MYGTLDSFSAFKFENYLQFLKKLLRKPNQPLAQIIRRIHESNNIPSKSDKIKDEILFSKEHNEGPLPSNDFEREYKICTFNNFKLTTKIGNNCCLLQDKSVVLIDNFASRNNNYYVIGKKFENVTDFFNEPCHSSRLDIFSVNTISSISVWSINDIGKKLVIFPCNQSFIVFPLLHI